MTKFGIIIFPGSNCDQDVIHVVKDVFHQDAHPIWHKDSSLGDVDAVVIPGGFSYGDYLRCGAIAKFSPIMKEVVNFANKGGRVLGICNGFQILVESGLLPGTLMMNEGLRFICDTVELKIENSDTPFTKKRKKGDIIKMPIAHKEGNYFIDADGLKNLQDQQQIVLKYVNNPNGAIADIAGIVNEKRNVMGLMPHPERVCEEILGGTDGKFIFESLIS